MPDPFRTAELRAAVLSAWAGSPTRFREDANAEEDLRLGGYADAWFVELAQNAADAARAAGVPGRIRVELRDGELAVANTGAPLDEAGVAALASLRASAKRDDPGSVGRFGVGFAAVLPVSDAPRVLSTTGGSMPAEMRTTFLVALAGMACLFVTLWKYELASKSASIQLRSLRRRLAGDDGLAPLQRSAAPQQL